MAGDWLKIREDLHEDPAVIRMALAMDVRPEHVVGYCVRFWGWASRNSTDGVIGGITVEAVEAVLNLPGFLTHLKEVGWLNIRIRDGKATFTIPHFDRYLSQGAKNRAKANDRQARSRATRRTPKATIPRPLRREIETKWGHVCAYCGWDSSLPRAGVGPYVGCTLGLDHVIPESLGGPTSADNLVTCCAVCNGVNWPPTNSRKM